MHDSLYIVVEIGAGFAAIITFMATFVTVFRKWVLDRIDRDLAPHLAGRDDLAARHADRARDAAAQAVDAAAEAREAARQAKEAAFEAHAQSRPPRICRSGDTVPSHNRADRMEGGRERHGDARG